ncbi:ATP-binding protein [Thiomicrorhabdus sp. ZW0627]|uniref:sensor histidine kinase n=1 Tax=Thiomicrorhabdus sp. ZW0627 TaxID=3039774 RepID=UPI002436D354|nr:ATP-binding protein [Thiomicrorhabdus sp. ZW0627]MDG6773349.1 ATP-binding protein [Thiomicrorhabdus sp. ZW0627]
MLNEVEKNRLVELEQAFELFNETSLQLTHAYEALQQQVSDLQMQLAKSDREKRRVADRLSRLLNLLPAGVIVLNQNDEILEMNPSAEGILGADALGRNWDVVVMNAFLTRNDAGELITHDEKVFQYSETDLDQALGKILLIQDVTSARHLQDHVNRHQRLNSMGEMAASLAHQIRTPLASALLYVSQMNSEQLDEPRREKFVGKALHSLRHLEGLVKDMLQYAKGGKGSEQRVELRQLLELVKHAVEQQAKLTGSEVQFDSFIPGLAVTGDQDGLVTALQNLIGNAIDVVGKEAKVQVTVNKLGDDKVDIVVSDNGPGIESENLEKVFEPFYTSRAKGTGLGLAVVRAIAEAHNGQAWVKSIPGYGSKFGIRLPLAEVKGIE